MPDLITEFNDLLSKTPLAGIIMKMNVLVNGEIVACTDTITDTGEIPTDKTGCKDTDTEQVQTNTDTGKRHLHIEQQIRILFRYSYKA